MDVLFLRRSMCLTRRDVCGSEAALLFGSLKPQMFLGCFFPREYVVVVVVIIPDDPMHEQIM